MAKTNFSGPITTGPIQVNTGTTIGTNVRDASFLTNVGSLKTYVYVCNLKEFCPNSLGSPFTVCLFPSLNYTHFKEWRRRREKFSKMLLKFIEFLVIFARNMHFLNVFLTFATKSIPVINPFR